MAFFDTGTNPFEGMNIFGAKPSEALTGVLDPQQEEKLKNQALVQGLLGSAFTYFATPKNLNQGSALPYLGKAFLGGMQQSQNVYDTALKSKLDTLNMIKTNKQIEMEGLTPVQKILKARNELNQNSPTYQNDLKVLDEALKKETSFAPPQTVFMGQEKSEAKTVGEFYGKQYADIQTAGYQAGNKLNKINRLNTLLEGVDTGKYTPLGTDVAAGAKSIGFNIDPKLGNKQAATSLLNEMALELRNPSGGAGMPGAMSDADRNYLAQIVPNLSIDKNGRQLITETNQALAKRDQDVARLARDYRKKHGNIDEGFYDELSKFSNANPLFTSKNKTIEVKF